MTKNILPAFQNHPKEARIIGRLLAGYGELELQLCQCLRYAIHNLPTAVNVLFQLRGEDQRIQIADALMKHIYEDAGLLDSYTLTIKYLRHCKSIRNQYAHCHWNSENKNALYFVKLEKAAKTRSTELKWRKIDLTLLRHQENFFLLTDNCLKYLHVELRARAAGKRAKNKTPIPSEFPLPDRHSG